MSLLTGLSPLLNRIQQIEGIFSAAREQTRECELWWNGPKEGLKSKGELQKMDAISLTDEEAQRLGHISRTLSSAVFLNQEGVGKFQREIVGSKKFWSCRGARNSVWSTSG
ncbi:hypothetical protein T01_4863 [Trichinella spiralis]|uniref:Uncharacterized protein n=1 Tax=Trichinella spiralis TaxID=6334 RepID=A0A0V1ALH0_TRISP|nr:hypothetical protein T01_4863 [Trichinella spiralis]